MYFPKVSSSIYEGSNDTLFECCGAGEKMGAAATGACVQWARPKVQIRAKAASNKQHELKLIKLGVFTRSQAEAMGLIHQRLSRLVEEEKIIRRQRVNWGCSQTSLGLIQS